jgi:hypothetical protein
MRLSSTSSSSRILSAGIQGEIQTGPPIKTFGADDLGFVPLQAQPHYFERDAKDRKRCFKLRAFVVEVTLPDRQGHRGYCSEANARRLQFRAIPGSTPK